MRSSFVLIGILISCICIAQVYGACLCGSIGEDYCTSCRGLRPVPKFLGKPDIPAPALNPIGDKCSCGKQLVEPAYVPRTCCCGGCKNVNLNINNHPFPYSENLCSSCALEGKASCSSCKSCSCSSCKASAALKISPISHCPCQIGPWIHANAIQRKCSGIPADPVSVSIAHRNENARSFSVPEEKVSYGHRTTPLCPVKRIYISNIPEENLWSINKQIIELKRKGFTNKKQNEEIVEEESEEEEVGPSPNYLTYGELGYCPEKFTGAKFTKVPTIGQPSVPECMLPPPPIGDCGFKKGAIVPFNMIDPVCTMEEHLDEV